MGSSSGGAGAEAPRRSGFVARGLLAGLPPISARQKSPFEDF